MPLRVIVIFPLLWYECPWPMDEVRKGSLGESSGTTFALDSLLSGQNKGGNNCATSVLELKKKRARPGGWEGCGKREEER
jgi:hypothetical protein